MKIPFDLNAEAVLSAVLLAATAQGSETNAAGVHHAHAQRFFAESHRRIFEVIEELANEVAIDVVLVAARLRDKGQARPESTVAYHLTRVLNMTPAITHVLDYCKVVERHALARMLILSSYGARSSRCAGKDAADVVLG